MKNFNTASKDWSMQSAGNALPEKLGLIKNKQGYTVAVLCITAIVLVSYAVWVINPDETLFNTGMLLMILSVVVRIVLEIKSMGEGRRMSPATDLISYHHQIKNYRQNRLQIHQIWTPILLITYWTGFVLLIPAFKQYLNNFMFQYVCWSSIPIAIVMVWLIAREVKKEKLLLSQIKSDLSE